MGNILQEEKYFLWKKILIFLREENLVEVQHLVPVLCSLGVPEAVHVRQVAVDAGAGRHTQQVLGPAVAAAVRQPVGVGVGPVRHVAGRVLL